MGDQISQITGAPLTDDEANELANLEFDVGLSPPWRDSLAIHIRGTNPHLDPTSQTKYIAVGLRIEKHDHLLSTPAAISLSMESATELMGQLWSLGIRPAERHLPTPATLGAVNSHLEDMRKLAFDLINKLVLKR
jgi:hypothetical protein